MHSTCVCDFVNNRLSSIVALVTLSASIFPRMNSNLQNCRACSSVRPIPLRKRPYCMRPPCRRWWFSLRLWWSCLMQSGKDFPDSWRRRSEEKRWAAPVDSWSLQILDVSSLEWLMDETNRPLQFCRLHFWLQLNINTRHIRQRNLLNQFVPRRFYRRSSECCNPAQHRHG